MPLKQKQPVRPVIKAVLFDLGKVLFYFDFEPAFLKLSRKSKKTPDEIKAFFIQSGLEVLYDGGKISSHKFYLEVKKGLCLDISFEGFKKIWNDIFTPIEPMIKLVSDLHGKKRLVLISNTNAMHFEHIKKTYPILKKFNRHILSYKEKIRKPDHQIYETASKACRAKPEQIFYIDDRSDLTEAAKDLGFHIHTFKNDHKILVTKLKNIGVL